MADLAYTIGAAATRIDLTVAAGDLFDLHVPILDGNGQPLAISDADADQWAVRATVRRNSLASASLHEWSTGTDAGKAFIVPGSPAQVRLIATPTETGAWQTDWPSYSCGWDLDIVEPQRPSEDADMAATPFRIASGRFVLSPQYSR